MGHGVKECTVVSPEVKELLEDDMPYFLALKSELNFPSKLSLRLGAKIKSMSSQISYLGSEEGVGDDGSRSLLPLREMYKTCSNEIEDRLTNVGEQFSNSSRSLCENDNSNKIYVEDLSLSELDLVVEKSMSIKLDDRTLGRRC